MILADTCEPWSRRSGARTVVGLLAVAALALLHRTVYVNVQSTRWPLRNSEITLFTSSDAAQLIEDMRIDINRANAGDLQLLPGIGPTLAHRIVENRELQGEFTTIEDLTRVKGIGERTVQGLRGLADAITADEK